MVGALVLEAVGEVVQAPLHLGADERLGHVLVDQLDQRPRPPRRAAPAAPAPA